MMNMASPEHEIRRTLDELTCQIGDPHTWFIPERGARRLQGLLSGQASALPGFTLHRTADGRFVVGEVVDGSPAQAAGVMPGDVVRSIAGVPVTMGMRDTFRVNNHEPETTVELDVVRNDRALKLELCVSDWHMPLTEVRTLEQGIGYVRLRLVTTSESAEGDASALVGHALEALESSGVQGLVLDLRSNPGGYGVTRVASHFTRADPLLFYANSSGDDEPARNAGSARVFDGRIVVLVDDQTLSSAEMITLCLRECVGAKVVGQPTGGGLNVPRRVVFANGDMLMVPERPALGPRSRACPPGMRIEPDILSPNRTPTDFVNGRDPQLAMACEILAGQINAA